MKIIFLDSTYDDLEWFFMNTIVLSFLKDQLMHLSQSLKHLFHANQLPQ